jgi:pantoate--beta-alanine ligase
VIKLLNIVRPTVLYLGQKDAAQCVMIGRMVEDLNLEDSMTVDVIPTVRESDGLALSSRNAYLTPIERNAAPVLYRSLCAARGQYEAYKLNSTTTKEVRTIPSAILYDAVESLLRSEPLVSVIHYISIDNRATMRPLDQVVFNEGAIISIACQVGNVRLIDNIIVI